MTKETTSIDRLPLREEPILLPVSIFLATSFIALFSQWQLRDLCWAVWLTEVVIAIVVYLFSSAKIFLAATGLRPLLPSEEIPDGKGGEEEFGEASLIKRITMIIPTFFFLGFVGFCFFGFYAFYGVALQIMFPVVGVPIRTASFLSIFLLSVDLIWILLPDLWVVVLGSVILQRKKIFFGPPGWQILGLGEGNLMKIHFSLLLLPPLALIIQHYVPNWQTVVLILLLFVFFFPWSRTHDSPGGTLV